MKLEKYRAHLDEFDLSDEQKTEMIEALWRVAEAATDMAYGIDPVHLLNPANDNDSQGESNVVELFKRFAPMTLPREIEQILPPLEANNDNQQED